MTCLLSSANEALRAPYVDLKVRRLQLEQKQPTNACGPCSLLEWQFNLFYI